MDIDGALEELRAIRPEIQNMIGAINQLLGVLDELETMPASSLREAKLADTRRKMKLLVGRMKQVESDLNEKSLVA